MASVLKDVLRLYRLHTAGATASIPLVAGFILGASPIPLLLITLGSIFQHAWGFSLNEIIDLEVDRRSGIHGEKPLVSGRISRSTAHVLSLSALVLSLFSYLLAANLEGGSLLFASLFFLGATLSGTIYNVKGKSFPLSDVFVGGWLFFLVLTVSAVCREGPLPETAVLATAVLGGIHLLFNNSVEGGIKDAEGDRRSGVRSLAVVAGVNWKGNRVEVPRLFTAWGIGLRASFVILASVFSYLIMVEYGWGSWIVVTVSIIGVVLFTHSLGFMRSGVHHSRSDLIKTFSVHEVSSLALSLLVIVPAAGPIPAFALLVLPLLWFIVLNRCMYGTSLAPKV